MKLWWVVIPAVLLLASCGGDSENTSSSIAPAESTVDSSPTTLGESPTTTPENVTTVPPVELPSGEDISSWLDEGLPLLVDDAYEAADKCMTNAGYPDTLVYYDTDVITLPYFGVTAALDYDYGVNPSGWEVVPTATPETMTILFGESALPEVDGDVGWGSGCLADGFAGVFGDSQMPYLDLQALIAEVETTVAASDEMTSVWKVWGECAPELVTLTATGQPEGDFDFWYPPEDWFPTEVSQTIDLVSSVKDHVIEQLYETGLSAEEYSDAVQNLYDYEGMLDNIDQVCRVRADLDNVEESVFKLELENAYAANPEAFLNVGYEQ